MLFTRSHLDVVTTTNNIDGWKIKRYYEPVFSHVVAGTNLFSDFFASITDVLGFRSGSYQKQLKYINDTAIKELKKTAAAEGANCIIGLKIDHDEISGKNKSMFMVTASGTPVFAEKIVEPGSDTDPPQKKWEVTESEILSHEEMEFSLTLDSILQQIRAGDFNFDEDGWKFIKQAEIEEIIPLFTDNIESLTEESQNVSIQSANNTKLEQMGKIFISFPPQKINPHLYPLIKSENQKTFDYVFKILKSISGVDYPMIVNILQHDDLAVKKRALKLLTIEKYGYSGTDLEAMKKIVELLDVQFPPLGETITQKGMLGGKEKTLWVCSSCETKNDEANSYCKKCRKERRGFEPQDATPETISPLLVKKIAILEQHI